MSGTDVINVTDPPYNAVGDGVTDDTAAIQSAISAMGASTSRVLYFPQGTYKISQSLDFSGVPGGQFRVEGAGGTLSTIEVAANNVAAIKFTGSGPTAPQVANLGFTVSDPSLTGTTAIQMSGATVTSYMSNANIADVTITGYATGIALSDCLTNAISNVTVVSIPASGTGFALKLAGQTTLTNCVAGSGTAGSNATGFLIQGSSATTSLGEGIFMSDCNANGPNIGLQITDTHFGTVTGCSFTSCPGGAVVSSNTPGGIGSSAWSFSACQFNASTTAPAVLMDANANFNQFTGCWEFSSQYGIQLQGGNNAVSGCQFVLNQAGDVLLDGAGGNNISSNICFSGAPAGFSIAEQTRAGVKPFLNLIASNTVFTPIAPLVAGSGSILASNLVENPGAGSGQTQPCFVAGTRIATAGGDIAVEALRPGDRVRLAGGGTAPVVWLGHRRLAIRRHPRPWDVQPVRIRKHAFGPDRPRRDLLLSPDHAVAIDGALIPVRYLLNGATILQQPVATVTYWHVELEHHALLLAEDLPAESYLDTGNRAAFANGGGAINLHPVLARATWDARACAPLVTDGPALSNARAALLRQALRLGHATTADPALELLAAGRSIIPHRAQDGAWLFDLPPDAGHIRLRSRTAVPGHIRVADADHRRLGVAVSRLILDQNPIALTDPRLGAGWLAMEDGLRWTDGDAALAVGPARRLRLHTAPLLRYWAAVPGHRGELPVAGSADVA